MKKLKESVYVKTDGTYIKEIEKWFKQKIYDIGLAIIYDEYLVDKKSESKDKEWDYIEE